MGAAAGLAPARPGRAAAAARHPDHLAVRLGPARRARAGPRRHLRRRGRRGGVLADVAPPRAQLPAPAAAPDRGRSRRRGHRRLDRRRCHVGPARLARAPADLDLPGWLDRRVRLAAPARGRPGGPPAPRRCHRLDGAEGRMAPGRAPDRAGRLPPAEGHPDAARRGTPAHQRTRQRPGVPGRAEQRRDRREIRAPGRPAVRPRGHQHHRVPRAADHRHPPRGPVRQGHRVPPAHHPVAVPGAVPLCRLVPRRGDDPRPGPGRDHPGDRRAHDRDPVRRDRRQGHRGARGHRQREVHPAQRRPGAGHRDARRRPGPGQRRAHGRRAHLGTAGRGHRLRPGRQRRGGAGQDPRRAGMGAATGHRAVRHPRPDRAQRVPADPGRPRLSS